MIRRLLIALSALLFACTVAFAQFADQATFAGTGAGSANVQTLTLPNASSLADIQGVLIKYIPAATNTAATTLTVGNGSTTFAPTAVRKLTGSGLTALTGAEIVTGQAIIVMYDGTFFDIVSGQNNQTTAATLANSALAFGMPVNLQLNASVGTNQLTISVKGNNGSDPSAGNPVLIPFRDSVIGNGDPVIVSLQAALSFTVASSNTMGCANTVPCRLWVVAINNGGTVGLCAFNALSTTSGISIATINEGILQSSASGTSGGSTAQTYYCNISSVSSKAVRILGYMELTETVAGTWTALPTFIQLMGPGIKKPGDPVKHVYTTTSSVTTTATGSYVASANTASITPESATNVIHIEAGGIAKCAAASSYFMQYRRGTTTTVGIQQGGTNSSGAAAPGPGPALDNPGVITSVTYTVYIAGTGSGVTYPNSDVASPGASMILEEIMGALPEPADDNGTFGNRMVG